MILSAASYLHDYGAINVESDEEELYLELFEVSELSFEDTTSVVEIWGDFWVWETSPTALPPPRGRVGSTYRDIMALEHNMLEALIHLAESASAEEAKTAIQTLVTVVSNAQATDKRVLKTSNPGLQKRLLGLQAGEKALIAAGFLPDAAAGTFEWDSSLDASVAAERSAGLRQALQIFDAIHAAIVSIGDSNAPSVAQEALKLSGVYVGNIATEPDSDNRRCIGAANKALNSRLLSAKGGSALLAACGFVAEPAQGEPESYVNQLGTPFVRVALVALGKATAVWAALAASRGSAIDVSDGPRDPRGPKLTASEQNTPVEAIVLKALPVRSALLMTRASADMQPALCKSDDGRQVLLHTWQEASHSWTCQGSMEIPSTEFVWTTPRTLLVLVDLGDAHGSGQPVELRVALNADGTDLENDYVTARDFIEGHIADSYTKCQEPVLNANYLEEISRKLRAAAGPVMATVANLKKAMEAQN